MLLKDKISHALNTHCLCEGKEYQIRDLINDDTLYFILFFYELEELETYYRNPYRIACINSWLQHYPNAKLLWIRVEDDVSEWTKFTFNAGKRNFPTDSLRLIYCYLLKNAAYLDTDVYLTDRVDYSGFPKTFIADYCSGTLLWSTDDKDGLIKWFDWYENEGLNECKKKDTAHFIGDVEAYFKTKYVENRNINLNHFSKLYPLKRDGKTVSFHKYESGTKVPFGRLFNSKCYEALLLYCLFNGYHISIDSEDKVYLF